MTMEIPIIYHSRVTAVRSSGVSGFQLGSWRGVQACATFMAFSKPLDRTGDGDLGVHHAFVLRGWLIKEWWFHMRFTNQKGGVKNEDVRRGHGIIGIIGQQWLVGGLVAIFYFPRNIGNVIIPIDELIFFRGVAQPPTRWDDKIG